MANEKSMRVAGYARVSTDNQLENYSIAQQEQRLTAYCQAKDWNLTEIYVDGGYSGGNMERPALKRLLEAVKAGGIDAVLVYKLDRLSRSQKDTLLLIEDGFLAHGTDFISINENFDTSTPFGRAMIGMLSVFAQLERDQITERFTMGRVGRCRAGYFHGGGSSPTGYSYTGGQLVVDEYQALQVREAFQLFLSGQSLHGVSRLLSKKYAPTWTTAKVRTVLRNGLYIGKVHFQGQEYPGLHQPLIDLDSFQQANRLLDEMAEIPSGERKAFRAKFLLSGMIICGQCGSRYAAGHGCYRCYSRSKSTPKYVTNPHCTNDNWPIHTLDNLVTRQVIQLLEDGDVRQKLYVESPSPLHSAKEALEARLAEIAVQQERLVELYRLNTLPEEVIACQAKSLAKEKNALSEHLALCEPAPSTGSPLWENFLRGFQLGPVEKRRAFTAALIEKIVLDGSRITIHWRI